MTPLGWMMGASLVSWLLITTATRDAVNPEALFGMIGPLAASGLTWALVARAHASAPEQVMRVLIQAFAAKMVFFGVYVAVMLRALDLRPVPFVISFTGYFIGLYAMQALFLRRLR